MHQPVLDESDADDRDVRAWCPTHRPGLAIYDAAGSEGAVIWCDAPVDLRAFA